MHKSASHQEAAHAREHVEVMLGLEVWANDLYQAILALPMQATAGTSTTNLARGREPFVGGEAGPFGPVAGALAGGAIKPYRLWREQNDCPLAEAGRIHPDGPVNPHRRNLHYRRDLHRPTSGRSPGAPGGQVHDWGVIAAPWGFRPQDITIEVDLWQGDQDDRVPPHHGAYLAGAIPRSHLTMLRGEGHMIAFTCIEQALAQLTVSQPARHG